MYNEIYGMPGIGKTTICDKLVEKYSFIKIKKVKKLNEFKIVPFIQTIPKFLSIITFIYSCYLDTKFIHVTWKKRRMFFKSLFVCLYHYYETRKYFKSYITDHGIIQTLSQLEFIRMQFGASMYKRLIKKLPCKFIMYYYLKADPICALKRGQKRAVKQKKKFDRDIKQLKDFNIMFEIVEDYIMYQYTIDAKKYDKNISQYIYEISIMSNEDE